MRIVNSRYLDDGKGFNDGREADLIKIESPADFDEILANIDRTGYYDRGYLQKNLGYQGREVKFDNLVLAAIIELMQPKSLLELGCGAGDVLMMLRLRGLCEVRGLDVSQDIADQAFPELEGMIDIGQLIELKDRYLAQGSRFDFICGFDIWEHLHPASLEEHIRAVRDLATDDALFFFIIPAFGEDEVFGEPFPLEFAENRESFDANQPFTHLLAETLDPPIPQNGHLIWSTGRWWRQQFEKQGLIRCQELERMIHQRFDPNLALSARTFFIFRKDHAAATRRAKGLVRRGLSAFRYWQLLRIYLRQARLYEIEHNRHLVDPAKMLWAEDGAAETLLAGMERRFNLMNPAWLLGKIGGKIMERLGR